MCLFACLLACGQSMKSSVDSTSEQVVSEDSLELIAVKGIYVYNNEPYNGEATKYYDNGQIATSISYKNGKKHGVIKKWFSSGVLSYEAHYTHGKKDGKSKTWWKHGTPKIRIKF